jgi:hypothetical protein
VLERQVMRTTGRVVAEGAIAQGKASLGGVRLRPDDEGYELARRIWNPMRDKKPADGCGGRGGGRSSVFPLVP